ncbi:MAG: FecR domain-containing protein [Rhodospirillaceae bacterium]
MQRLWGTIGIVAGATGYALACAPAGAQDASRAGGVTAVYGSATAVRNTAQDALALNDPIFRNDILETGPDGKLRVTFADNTQLTLGPDADVVIDDFVYAPEKKAGNAALRIAAGTARVIAGAIEDNGGREVFSITTPVATIGIRGTDFFVELEGDHLQVALFSGYEVTVTNEAGVTVLRPGEGTDVWGAAAPTPGIPWGPDRVNRALAMVSPIPNNTRALTYARPPAQEDSLMAALTRGDVTIDARLRYEHVSQANAPLPAYAATARLRVGYETAAFRGVFAGLEGEITRELSGKRSDGAIVLSGRPAIPDPDSEELNQLYAGWSMAGDDGMTAARAVLGRQRLIYDNERWIGAGAFRQNDQTFDAVAVEGRPMPHLAVRYAYIDGVNRVLGNSTPNGHWRSDSHALGVTTDLVPYGLLTGYAYLIDLQSAPQFSSATYGVRYDTNATGGEAMFGLEAELARQVDYRHNTANYALTYALLRPSIHYQDTTLFAGVEFLEGNGVNSVQTPLATLHRHNGWADVVDIAPAEGLRDVHVRYMQELPDFGPVKTPRLDLRLHHFTSDSGVLTYGTEFDADFNVSLMGYATVGVRWARYEAKNFASDTEKLWLYVETRF